MGQGRRRRLSLIAVAVIAICLVGPELPTGAGAAVANPGIVDVSMTLGVITPTLSIEGVTTTHSAQGRVGAKGWFRIPQANLEFSPIDVTVDLPNPTLGKVSVQLVATSDFTGFVNPKSGLIVLAGNFTELWSQPGTLSSCPVGPFTFKATTLAGGASRYEVTTGTATIVDGLFTVDTVPSNTPGCGGLEDAINSTLSLPITTTTTSSSSSSTSTSTSTTTTTTTTTVPVQPASATTTPLPMPAVVVSLTFTPAPRAPHAKVPLPKKTPGSTSTTVSRPTTPPTSSVSTSHSGHGAPHGHHKKNPNKHNHPKKNPNKVGHPNGNPNKHKHPHHKNPNKVKHPHHKNPNKVKHPNKAAFQLQAPRGGPSAFGALGAGSPTATSSGSRLGRFGSSAKLGRSAPSQELGATESQLALQTASSHRSAISSSLWIVILLLVTPLIVLGLGLIGADFGNRPPRRRRAHANIPTNI